MIDQYDGASSVSLMLGAVGRCKMVGRAGRSNASCSRCGGTVHAPHDEGGLHRKHTHSLNGVDSTVGGGGRQPGP